MGIYNCIVISQVYDVIDKEHRRPINVTDVDLVPISKFKSLN